MTTIDSMTKNNRQIIGRNLAAIRAEAQMTQLELAKRLRITRGTVTRWESGQTIPDIVTFHAIAVATEQAPSELAKKIFADF